MTEGVVEIGIGLGANLGDRRANLRRALALLAPTIRVTAVSSLYETAPLGLTDQPAFLNAACLAETDLHPLAVMLRFNQIEWQLGRRRGEPGGPREIDLDLLFFGDIELVSAPLTIPHPRLRERGFVLQPLAEVAPARRLPGWEVDLAAALAAGDTHGVVWVEDARWAANLEPDR